MRLSWKYRQTMQYTERHIQTGAMKVGNEGCKRVKGKKGVSEWVRERIKTHICVYIVYIMFYRLLKRISAFSCDDFIANCDCKARDFPRWDEFHAIVTFCLCDNIKQFFTSIGGQETVNSLKFWRFILTVGNFIWESV